MPDKACAKCGTAKPLDQFYFEKTRDRHKAVCKACYPRTKNRQTPEQRAAYRRRCDPTMGEYRTREQILADAEAKRQAKAAAAAARAVMSPEPRKPAVGSKAWYAIATQDEIAEYRATMRVEFRRYYARNTEKQRLKTKRYKQRCRDRVSQWGRDRWSRLAESADGTLTQTIINQMMQDERFCAYCMKEMDAGDKTLDHVEPLGRGGAHSIDNVVVCCRACNVRKGNKILLLWLREISEGQTAPMERAA